MARRDAILSERVAGGEICVFPVKGGYAAEYKLGRAKLPIPIPSSSDAAAMMSLAKSWLAAPIYGKRGGS